MRISRGALAAALVVACGSAQHGPAKQEPAPKLVTYGPLGIKADAKSPNLAAILGTDDKNGSTLIALPAAPSTVVVDPMHLELTTVTLATAPNRDPSAPIRLGEKPAGVWVSAIVAATMLDKDLTDYTLSASSGGYIDGPSASGLIAGGFLAAMTGVPVDPGATLTGTINPDGTIGPVSGIPEKFLGAIEKGKKRLGYPSGMRMAKSRASGELVDLVQLAKQHGAEAVEIADVHAAYKLLTRRTLPEAVPVAEAEMALDKETVAALEAKYKDWQTRVGSEWATLVQLENAGRLPPLLGAMRQYAKTYAETAEALHKRGMTGAAYSRMLAAWAFASATTRAYDLLQKVQSGNIAAAIDSIKALDRLDETSLGVLEKIGTLRPATLGGHVQMMAAFEAGLRGYAFKQMASMSIAQTTAYLDSLKDIPAAQLGSPEAADKIMQAIAPAL
ncbi:MAG TPA: S16 family serine protease, partial [Kofleriaceae bacterium]|nr:S16 family serine protease [Kofleriaceae bacterium]